MSPTLQAFLRSWPFDPWLFVGLLLPCCIYLRGWIALQRRDRARWSYRALACFLAGLVAIYLALASPIEPWTTLLLQVHMLQHLLLMMAAPPLLWLGEPLFPILRGLPAEIRICWAGPLFRSGTLRRALTWLTHPARALALFIGITWAWHIPAAYDLALRSDGWHYVQHLCFFGAGLVFWYPVVRPYPSRPRWSLWLLPPMLILADVANTLLSALLTFSGTVLYGHYAEVPRVAGLSALEDQAAAGVLMWVPGSLAFLAPLFVIGIRLLYPQSRHVLARASASPSLALQASIVTLAESATGSSDVSASREASIPASRIPLPVLSASTAASRAIIHRPPVILDTLRLPLLGPFLKWRHARLALQVPVAVLATCLIVDGLRGPQVGAMNLAGVLPWIHWRGIVILGLLAVGNVSCMACPFTLPRTLARRWLPGGWAWPRWLRNKWLAVALLALFLWEYEAFSLWDSPWWTAWIAIGYFVLAFAIDAIFRGGSFCKYVCPIGQFNFVQSLVSPFEVKIRDADVCTACQTKDCIRGRDGIPGCELKLFQGRKSGNMDCTVCLDCVHACPHDNIGISASVPGEQLWHDSVRSGIGRFSKRPDLAALVVVLVFGAFANAAGMTAPVQAWEAAAGAYFGHPSPLIVTSAFYFAMIGIAPFLLVGAAALWSHAPTTKLDMATRFAFALVPIGFGMWLAHYSFHFLTSYETLVPVTQRFSAEIGFADLGAPRWQAACCRAAPDWLPKLEILFLDLGLLLSLYTGYRIAKLQFVDSGRALCAFAPWALLVGLLFAAGIWLVFQPMQMRGTL
jgi:cytochrome c oxidase assembly factor CtaG/ferredoxin